MVWRKKWAGCVDSSSAFCSERGNQSVEENKVHVTVRLGAVAVILILLVVVLGWLRYDLGKEAFYDAVQFAAGGLSVLLIMVIAFLLFRLVQRSDNKEISQAGETKAMYQLLEEQRRSNTKETIALVKLLVDGKGNQLALPNWGDDEDEDDTPAIVQTPTSWVNEPVFTAQSWQPAPAPQHNGNGHYKNGNGNGNGH